MNPDFSNLPTGTGPQQGIFSPDALSPVQGADKTSKVSGQPTKDSIEKVSAEIASLYLPPMSNPILIPPDPNMIVAIGQLAMDKICLSILDEWSKSLAQIAEEKKEADRKAELNPIWREVHLASAIILSVATIFIRAIFGTNIAEGLKVEGPASEKAIAQRFATQLNAWALSGVLKGYLMTIVDKLPTASYLSENQKAILSNQIQIMLLASSLASLYKIQFNWITSEEFIHLLGKPDVLNNPDATVLSMLIVNTLSELPDGERNRMARTLALYMDTNPSLPTLFDLGKTAEVQLSILHSSAS